MRASIPLSAVLVTTVGLLMLVPARADTASDSSLMLDPAQFTATLSDMTEPDFEAMYQEMMTWRDCTRKKADPRYLISRKYACAEKLKSNGDWKQPDLAVVNSLKNELVRKEVRSIAELYGIDARALIGAVLAEGSINQNWAGKRMEAGLDRLGKAGYGSALGNLSIGIAQINEGGVCQSLATRKAIETEKMAQMRTVTDPGTGQTRQVSVYSCSDDWSPNKALSDLRGTDEESFKFAAGLIRSAQDEYRAVGCDISANIGALVTLYNMGLPRSKARRSDCRRGGSVGWNFFGLFAEKNLATINQIVGESYVPAIAHDTAIRIPPPPALRSKAPGLRRHLASGKRVHRNK
jgi:hypothetical protein